MKKIKKDYWKICMMEENTLKIIEDLNLSESQTTLLIEAIEWEKELSWSDGYATAADQANDILTGKIEVNQPMKN
jgi:hypothetical protein